ncbi:MAG: hypothetical protein GY798_06255 [Hyphomicrobiales bacterium]|nr:hypothetical protein [Hyphomicrobiales bacterium]
MFDRFGALRGTLIVRTGLTVALLLAVAMPGLAQVTMPPRGSPLRSAILEGVRPMVVAETGAPVEFVVHEMRVVDDWAFVLLSPQRPGGAAIDYRYTRYGVAVAEGFFDNQVSALLRRAPNGWLVFEYNLGATDVPWVAWGDYHPVPMQVFPGN